MSLETKGPIFPVVRDRGERTSQFEARRPHVSRDMAPISSLETGASAGEAGLAGSQNWRGVDLAPKDPRKRYDACVAQKIISQIAHSRI